MYMSLLDCYSILGFSVHVIYGLKKCGRFQRTCLWPSCSSCFYIRSVVPFCVCFSKLIRSPLFQYLNWKTPSLCSSLWSVTFNSDVSSDA